MPFCLIASTIRHKIPLTLQDIHKKEPVLLSGITEFDETFVLDYYKGKPVPAKDNRETRNHGVKVVKWKISSEYIAICTGIQRDDRAVAELVNCAKPSGKEVCGICGAHTSENRFALTNRLHSYNNLKTASIQDA